MQGEPFPLFTMICTGEPFPLFTRLNATWLAKHRIVLTTKVFSSQPNLNKPNELVSVNTTQLGVSVGQYNTTPSTEYTRV